MDVCAAAQSAVELTVPCRIGDYTDFYTGIHHATTVGLLFRPDQPLMPNYKWVPIGYHGRASSIGVSGQTLQASARPDQGARAQARRRSGRRKGSTTNSNSASLIGTGQRARRTDRHRGRRAAPVRRDAAQRLVGARHPGLGVPAARPLPGQELRDHAVALDRDDGGARALPRASSSGRRPTRSRCPISIRRPTASAARSTSRSRSGCRPPQCARPASRPCA